MTTLEDLQRWLLQVYTEKGKGLDDFSDDLSSIISEGLPRERALITLALEANIEIEEISDMERRGLSTEEAILKFSEDLMRHRRFDDVLSTCPKRTVAHPTPNSLWYLLPLAFGILGGLVAYVYVKDDDPEMAKNYLRNISS